jgi:hypothetical protein
MILLLQTYHIQVMFRMISLKHGLIFVIQKYEEICMSYV